ncbi:MAG: carboxypeptidase regulatory-like domain-containing protein [Planctomycetota bacterium]
MRHGVRDPGTKRATDARGFATFSDLTPGEYLLLLPGGPRGTNAEVVVGETRTVELAADAQRLRVLVVGADGQPLPGAGVWCRHPNVERGSPPGVLAGTTDGAGVFAYRGLPLGSVWARKAGLQPSVAVSLRSPRGEIQSEPVDVKLELGPAGCSVLGSVVDPDGRAVAEARVLIACEDSFGSGSKREFLETRTDASGRFASDEVPVGERYIAAEAAGFAPACERVATAAEQPTTIVLALRAGASLSGRVSDAGGQPVAGVDITAMHRRSLPGLGSWSVWRTARTDDDGRYRIEAILPGEVEARATVGPGVTQEFTLADGEQRTWDVTRPPERAIHGTVLDPEGKPLARWMLRVMSTVVVRGRGGRPIEGMAITDAKGAFRIAQLEDSPYRVFVFAPTEGGARAGAAALVPRAVLENVRPSADALSVRIDAAAMASGWIEGSIVMPDGVQAKAVLAVYAKALLGGGFAVPQERLEAGQTTFRIGPLPGGEYDLYCDIEGRGQLSAKGLRLGMNETLRLSPFAADAQRPLEIVLKHADGRPATGATVRLVTLEPFTEVAPGRYRSQPIAAGAYDVRVRGAGFAPGTVAVNFAGAEPPFEHTVQPAATVEVCCKPATPRERWIGAMQVELSDASGTEIVKELTQIDGKQDFTWSIGLRPGTYSLRCSEFGSGSGSTTFTVGTAPLRVDLQLAK